jgi:hypothetical protein
VTAVANPFTAETERTPSVLKSHALFLPRLSDEEIEGKAKWFAGS